MRHVLLVLIQCKLLIENLFIYCCSEDGRPFSWGSNFHMQVVIICFVALLFIIYYYLLFVFFSFLFPCIEKSLSLLLYLISWSAWY